MGAYDLTTRWIGFFTLWGGLMVQLLIIVWLAGLSETSRQSVGTAVAAYFLSMVIYFVIDVARVVGLEMRVNNWFFDQNFYERPSLTRPILLPTFFLFAAAANTFVVILPALDEGANFWSVALRGFVMGWFAYGNLALVQAWSYPRFPLELVGVMPLSGGVLSMSSSVLTTAVLKAAFGI